MNATTLHQVATWVGGRIVSGRSDIQVSGASIDSRRVQKGTLFIALSGARVDGHDFILAARDNGAAAALVSRLPQESVDGFPMILVPDAVAALGILAAAYRRTLPMRVIGLTGSSGKTSTKEMLAAVLSTKFLVTKTEGNLNNHLGVPLTLLEANSTDMFGVVEMGMNHPGEIRPLAEMAAPEIGVITNIGVAHIEYMGSREGIAREKGELLRALPSGGIGVFPAEDDFAHVLREMAPGAVITVGFWSGDVRAADIVATDCGMRFAATFAGETVQGEIPVPGRHMVMNGLLAVAAGIGAGVPFADAVRALGETKLTGGRLEIRTFEGAKLINDAYNSNPMSAIAALRTLHEMPGSGRRIAVMGRMGELGHEAENGHRDVGRAVAELGIDQLIGVGTEAGWMVEEARLNPATRAVLVADAREAAQLLRQEVSAGDIVLFKGSRSARIERVLQLLENPEEEVS